ncbi:MAG: ABC transporter permease [Candidatus Cloacimonetes bacterium]|nr:ABC transporter permease [Candidatus Cloacimonadota bacterium]
MSFKKALVIFRKEILEILRDKRTLFATIVLPVVLYPLLFIGFSAIMSRQNEVLEKRGATIALLDSLSVQNQDARQAYDLILSSLKNTPYLTTLESPPELERLYAEKEIKAVVSVSDSLSASGLATYKVGIRYDASGDEGQLLFGKLEKSLMQTAQALIAKRLDALNVEQRYIEPLLIDQIDTSTTAKKMGSVLGMILPYIVILMLVTGASVVAADLVAGEKERRTLETLLVSSASRGEIVLGKYLTIFTMAMLNVVINLISISLSVRYLFTQFDTGSQSLQLPVSSFLILLLAMVPLATLFSALLLSISTFSRNMKEARTYEQPIMIASMLMGMVSFIPSVEISNLLAMVPVINIALLFKAVLIGEWQLSHLLITVGTTLILDVFAIWVTVRLFHSEAVLFRTEDDSGGIKTVRTNKRGFFNPLNGLIYYSLALAALYYLGSKWQMQDLVKGLVQTQVFVIVLPVLLVLRFVKLKGAEARQLLRLKAPKLKEVALVPFIAISAAIVVAIIGQLINQIFPFPPDYLENLSKLFQLDLPLWQMFLVIAVLPGICEELLFRGFLLRFFEGKKFWYPVLASAALFAVFHLDPFRLLPTFLLGTLLGWLTLRSGSIYNSMLSHALNNGLALFIVTFAAKPWLKGLLADSENLQYWVVIPAILVLAASLWAFHKITADREVF